LVIFVCYIMMHGNMNIKFITFVFALTYVYKDEKIKFMNVSVVHHFTS